MRHVQFFLMPASQHKEQSKALYFRRGLAQLDVFRVADAGDQLLRFFAERIELFSLCSNPLSTSHNSGDSRIVESVF